MEKTKSLMCQRLRDIGDSRVGLYFACEVANISMHLLQQKWLYSEIQLSQNPGKRLMIKSWYFKGNTISKRTQSKQQLHKRSIKTISSKCNLWSLPPHPFPSHTHTHSYPAIHLLPPPSPPLPAAEQRAYPLNWYVYQGGCWKGTLWRSPPLFAKVPDYFFLI